MDGDFRLDMGEIARNIETAEVICIYFPLLRKTLMVDTRSDVEDPPLIKLVAMVDSIEERFRSIRRLRPRFTRPDSITVIPWPKYIDSMVRLGVWDRLVQRLVTSGQKASVKACADILEELRQLEKAELASVITGEHYHTIWEAKKT